jgi:hypothetical protein
MNTYIVKIKYQIDSFYVIQANSHEEVVEIFKKNHPVYKEELNSFDKSIQISNEIPSLAVLQVELSTPELFTEEVFDYEWESEDKPDPEWYSDWKYFKMN